MKVSTSRAERRSSDNGACPGTGCVRLRATGARAAMTCARRCYLARLRRAPTRSLVRRKRYDRRHLLECRVLARRRAVEGIPSGIAAARSSGSGACRRIRLDQLRPGRGHRRHPRHVRSYAQREYCDPHARRARAGTDWTTHAQTARDRAAAPGVVDVDSALTAVTSSKFAAPGRSSAPHRVLHGLPRRDRPSAIARISTRLP